MMSKASPAPASGLGLGAASWRNAARNKRPDEAHLSERAGAPLARESPLCFASQLSLLRRPMLGRNCAHTF